MPLVHMVLADSDTEYVHRLVQWFGENRPRQFQITAFTARESFFKYLEDEHDKADILLLNEGFLTPGLMDRTNLILLGGSSTAFPSIDKYQTASALCSAVLSHISGWQEVKPDWGRTRRSKLVVCFSPELQLKSTLALWLTRIHQEHLYVNLEAFPFYSLNSQNTGGRNISDVFYHIKASRGNLTIALESSVFKDSDGISHIPPMDNPGDLWEMTDSETLLLGESLVNWGCFSNILLDIECNTNPRTLQWLEMASHVLVPFTAAHSEPILRINHLFSGLPGASTGKYRWVLTGRDSPESLKALPEPLYTLPWLEALPQRWGSLGLEKQAFEQLKALLAE